MENEIKFLREECNFKTKLISSLLENLFNHENRQTKLHGGNTTLALNEAEDDYQFPKRQVCKRKFQSQSNPQLSLTNLLEIMIYLNGTMARAIVFKVRHLPPEQHAS